MSKSVVFFSGNQSGRHEYGTGFIIKEQLITVFCALNLSDILCYIRIKTYWYHISLLSVYVPAEDMDEVTKDPFYDLLERTVEILPKQDIIGLCPTKNRQRNNLVPAIGQHSLHNISNCDGQRLI
ncbi:hypothetical protein HUJ04_007279 [Dendroctonus ponderosae]|uniref:Uncharacterized protein n=1 Tax=Dendroctonus ponderosae TaxID=77166 RepID=A0AAR5PT22_DENPD|nr:hypothetical protein HUJ04_007279 [Dendroctonus ponderosae]KAH1025263.1 hypothetical protein HUJ05_010021 [Dendroctonus ponderosae]